MRKIKIGVFGGHRGTSMFNYCLHNDMAEVVAVCDKMEETIKRLKQTEGAENITFYESFDEFINHDMDAVVLANYANEHAPYAIRCLNRGLNVYSEVLPCQNLKEAVELVEAVENSGKVYTYGENYCYMTTMYEMRKLYKEGKIGEFEYGECEYVHNCEPGWEGLTYGDKNHWRNNVYSTFYCTHSIGPIIHMTGLRPVRVTGFEGTQNERNIRSGAKFANFGLEMIELENGGYIKSIHGHLYKNSVWYSVYGGKGRMEIGREDSGNSGKLYVNADEYSGQYAENTLNSYVPEANGSGHGGGDSTAMDMFFKKINGDENADTINVYEALDMFLPGLMAYRSILNGGIPMEIPDMRDKSVREKYRGDTACTDPKAAGNMLLPCNKNGNPDIPDVVYLQMKEKYLKNL